MPAFLLRDKVQLICPNCNKPTRVGIKIEKNKKYRFCKKCKKTHPIYESRCPHCHNILTFLVEPIQ